MMFDYEKRCFVQQGKISEKEKPSNKAKSKKVTASTLSDYHPN